MSKKRIEHFTVKGDPWQKLAMLVALLVVIFISIHVIRSLPTKESSYVDGVAAQIEAEMVESRIVLSAKGGRRTTAEFSDPVLLTHGSQSRLIVHTARLSETISIANEGWGGWEWTSAYQDVVYEGDAQYTVDLSGLTERDFTINNELKTLTVRIPYVDPLLKTLTVWDQYLWAMEILQKRLGVH